jgi:hypothetical protein
MQLVHQVYPTIVMVRHPTVFDCAELRTTDKAAAHFDRPETGPNRYDYFKSPV